VEDMTIEKEEWNEYYAVLFDGQFHAEGSFAEMEEVMLRALDDDCAQVFKVKIIAEEIFL
jgi:hypothetical protein